MSMAALPFLALVHNTDHMIDHMFTQSAKEWQVSVFLRPEQRKGCSMNQKISHMWEVSRMER